MYLDTSQGSSVAVFAAKTRPCSRAVEHASGVGQNVYEAYTCTVKRAHTSAREARVVLRCDFGSRRITSVLLADREMRRDPITDGK